MHLKPLAAVILSGLMGAAVAAPGISDGDLPAKSSAQSSAVTAPKSPAALSAVTAKLGLDSKADAKAVPVSDKQEPKTLVTEKSKAILDKTVQDKAEKPAAVTGSAEKSATEKGFLPVLEEGAVNPFTGEPLSAERRKREAERIRAENTVLEERIKQVGLLNDLNHAPVRKRVEMEQFLEQNKPKMVTVPVTKTGSAAVVETAAPLKASMPASVAAPVLKKSKTKAGKGAKVEAPKVEAPKVVEVQKPAVTAPAPVYTPPEVVGVIKTKDGSTAILNNNGRTILARPGEASSAGVVTAVSEKQVQLGSQTLEFRPSAVARIQRTDKEPQKQEPTATIQIPTRPQVTLPPIPGTGNATLPPAVRPTTQAGAVPGLTPTPAP